jgi:hypothetical protein
MTMAARLIQAPIALIASPQAMAPSHHGHIINSLKPMTMSQFHNFKEEQFSQAAQFAANGCPDPLGLTPKTVTLTE